MTLSPGQVLNNRYRIVKLLGQGGFGAVYRAWDMNLDFPRALKENLDTSSESQKQFKREAQILTGLTHPNLPRVIDHFIIPEQGQYLVMDYVEGQDLQEMLLQRNGPLPEAQVVGWIEQICSALEYLHAQNPPVVHRDIKPANIKITPQSKAMLVDFGIAKASEAGHATTIGAKAVTPGYSPIEQYGMGGHTGPRTDIYALGATMYALLTGQPPVESTLRVGRDPLTPTGQLNPEISPPVTVAIQKAMQVDAEQRYQSAGEFASALRSTAPIPAPGPSQPATFQPTQAVTAQFSSPPAAPPIQSTPEPTSNPASSRRWLWLAGLGLVALLAIGYIYIANANAMWPFAEQVVATSTQAATATQVAALAPTNLPPTKVPPTKAPPTKAPPTALPPTAPPAFKACQVTDTGGIDDKSFNATAWKGVTDAQQKFGIEAKYLESQQQTDYEKNINAFINENCDLIITVGFLLGDATQAAAIANPDQKFSIVDYAYDPIIPNVLGQVFNTDEAAFLAGYLAAGVSKTGKVGTFGGIQIPPVTAFMDGFAKGVQYYNKMNGSTVEVLGWDPDRQTGLFTGNFESTDDGRTMGQSLMDEGADIIMPVAGPVGLGTAAAAQERGGVYIIGVDNDWYVASPEYGGIILTSVLKNMDITTFNAIQAAWDDSFAGGVILGNLQNGGVGLASFHDLDSIVPDNLKAELEKIKYDIISGNIDLKSTP